MFKTKRRVRNRSTHHPHHGHGSEMRHQSVLLRMQPQEGGALHRCRFRARPDWLLWTVFGLETVNLLMDCVLLAGVVKENYRAIMAWVWVSVAQAVLTVIAAIASAFFVSPAPVSAAVVIAGVLFALVYSSAVVVVRSFG
nr:uncharacterized protein LOC113825952 isoform X2 [Penaeus vannamei]